jgi:hypothetical protein
MEVGQSPNVGCSAKGKKRDMTNSQSWLEKKNKALKFRELF